MTAAATTDLTIFSEEGYSATLKIAEALVKSGMLPRGIDNPFKAFAIIQKGREIGVGPMRALTGIALIEGKPTVSPELKLEQFKGRGGHVRWVKSDNTVAHLWLKAPNGDEHEEIVTLEDMQRAGVASKDNWRKYPKSMLRARCVGFGLRALGEGDGSYTPDELGAEVNESGEATYTPPAPSKVRTLNIEIEPPPGPSAPPPPNMPAPRKDGPGAWPKAVHERPIAAAARELDDQFRRANGAPVASDLEVALQRSIDENTIEVIDKVTGEVSQHTKMTKAQGKKIHAMVRALGISDESYRQGLRKYYSVDSSDLLTKAQAADMIERLQKTAERARGVNDHYDKVADDAAAPEDRGDEPTEEEMT